MAFTKRLLTFLMPVTNAANFMRFPYRNGNYSVLQKCLIFVV